MSTSSDCSYSPSITARRHDLIDPPDIARRRLAASGLVAPSATTPEAVVRRLLAIQSQEYVPAKWSVGQRAVGLNDGDLEAAMASASIVRTHVMRPTWHFVAREDIRWLLVLTAPRVRQKIARRFRDLGLDPRTLARCTKHIVAEIEGGRSMRRDEIAAILEHRRIDTEGQRLAFIIMHCELDAVLCSGPFDGRRPTFALLDERVPPAVRWDRDEALVALVRRYLTGHGPATVKDMSWWSGLTMADIRRGVQILDTDVRSATIDGMTFWWLAGEPTSPPQARGVYLLETFDETVVGYSESRLFGDPRRQRARTVWTDRMSQRGLIWLRGAIVGRWRHGLRKGTTTVEVALYADPTPATMRHLKSAAAEFGRFYGDDVVFELVKQ